MVGVQWVVGVGVVEVQGVVGWGSRCGGVSMCHSIDRLPILWLLHLGFKQTEDCMKHKIEINNKQNKQVNFDEDTYHAKRY